MAGRVFAWGLSTGRHWPSNPGFALFFKERRTVRRAVALSFIIASGCLLAIPGAGGWFWRLQTVPTSIRKVRGTRTVLDFETIILASRLHRRFTMSIVSIRYMINFPVPAARHRGVHSSREILGTQDPGNHATTNSHAADWRSRGKRLTKLGSKSAKVRVNFCNGPPIPKKGEFFRDLALLFGPAETIIAWSVPRGLARGTPRGSCPSVPGRLD